MKIQMPQLPAPLVRRTYYGYVVVTAIIGGIWGGAVFLATFFIVLALCHFAHWQVHGHWFFSSPEASARTPRRIKTKPIERKRDGRSL